MVKTAILTGISIYFLIVILLFGFFGPNFTGEFDVYTPDESSFLTIVSQILNIALNPLALGSSVISFFAGLLGFSGLAGFMLNVTNTMVLLPWWIETIFIGLPSIMVVFGVLEL